MSKKIKLPDPKKIKGAAFEKWYCFLLDIQDQLQFSEDNHLTLSPYSPNVDRFSRISNKLMPIGVVISNKKDSSVRDSIPFTVAEVVNSFEDWREGPIQILRENGIIRCEGVNQPLQHYPWVDRFEGVDLIVLDRKKFEKLLEEADAIHQENVAREHGLPGSQEAAAKALSKAKTSSEDDNYYKITYNNNDCEIVLNDVVLITKKALGSINDKIFCYLYENSNKWISCKEIVNVTGIQNIDLHKFVEQIMPVPSLSKAFFSWSTEKIIFYNPASRDRLRPLIVPLQKNRKASFRDIPKKNT